MRRVPRLSPADRSSPTRSQGDTTAQVATRHATADNARLAGPDSGAGACRQWLSAAHRPPERPRRSVVARHWSLLICPPAGFTLGAQTAKPAGIPVAVWVIVLLLASVLTGAVGTVIGAHLQRAKTQAETQKATGEAIAQAQASLGAALQEQTELFDQLRAANKDRELLRRQLDEVSGALGEKAEQYSDSQAKIEELRREIERMRRQQRPQ